MAFKVMLGRTSVSEVFTRTGEITPFCEELPCKSCLVCTTRTPSVPSKGTAPRSKPMRALP